MATYFNKYYFEFVDNSQVNPITWRVDILDSQGVAPTDPFPLTPAAAPLITERVDVSEDKFTTIIGRQITISYEYTGAITDPLPIEFFEADERRYRAHVSKNGVLDGVYYIKPDFSQYPDQYPPLTVQLKAVDGFSYLKGTPFDMYEDGLLKYEKINLYEAWMTRGLNQIFDVGTVINVLQSLRPVGSDYTFRMLFDLEVHTDMFYDFVEGPRSVYDVLEMFCKSFKARLFTDGNEIWFQRIQDLNYAAYEVQRYLDASTVSIVSPPDFVASIGPGFTFDAIPLGLSGTWVQYPAVKRAGFNVDYKSINQVSNFLWTEFNGTDFEDWERALGPDPSPPVGREGDGSQTNPYRALLPYSTNEFHYINQGFFTGTPSIPVTVGDIVQIEMSYRFDNTKSFGILVVVQAEMSGTFYDMYLTSSGSWEIIPAAPNDRMIKLTRSGKKRDGSFKLQSLPMPRIYNQVSGAAYPLDMELQIFLYYPSELSDTVDGPFPNRVSLLPIKIGIVKMASQGRHVQITNTAQFSQVLENEKFNFIDTGEDGLSNTLFWQDSPVNGGWEPNKPGVNPGDIERHMAISVIDQYQRSYDTLEGNFTGNTLNYFNVVEKDNKPGKKFMILRDTYNNRSTDRNIMLAEVFEERPTQSPPNENYTYEEWDIEEEKD